MSTADEITVEVTRPSIEEMMVELVATLTDNISRDKDLRAKVLVLQKELKKIKSIRTTSTRKGQPSGFSKPTGLCKELCEFMEIEANSMRPRTEITSFLNTYIKENDLQNPDNRREIFPDDKLRKLLSIKKDDKLTYFNLQTFMAPLFVKA